MPIQYIKSSWSERCSIFFRPSTRSGSWYVRIRNQRKNSGYTVKSLKTDNEKEAWVKAQNIWSDKPSNSSNSQTTRTYTSISNEFLSEHKASQSRMGSVQSAVFAFQHDFGRVKINNINGQHLIDHLQTRYRGKAVSDATLRWKQTIFKQVMRWAYEREYISQQKNY